MTFSLQNPYPGSAGRMPRPWGLEYRPTLETLGLSDAEDLIPDRHALIQVPYGVQVTDRDFEVMEQALRPEYRVFLEIGVGHNENPASSTRWLLGCLQRRGTPFTYLGVDLDDCGYLLEEFPGVDLRLVIGDSRETQRVEQLIQMAGGLDYLFIDGDHSVNCALADWSYARSIRPGGVVILHDTTVHPGPRLLYDAIDVNLWEKTLYFADRNDDWGIAVARRRPC